eukprot:gene24094-biopygen9828
MKEDEAEGSDGGGVGLGRVRRPLSPFCSGKMGFSGALRTVAQVQWLHVAVLLTFLPPKIRDFPYHKNGILIGVKGLWPSH